VILHEG